MQFLITVPIFSIIAMGFLSVRFKFIPKDAMMALGKFVLFFAVPCVIFRALSKTDFNTVFDPHFLLAYAGGCLATFVIFFLISKYFLQSSITESGLNAFGTSLPNSIIIGVPLLIYLFGSLPSAAFTMALIVENALIFPLALLLMDIGLHKGEKDGIFSMIKAIGVKLLRNQFILAIFAGLLVSALHIPIPAVITKIIDILAQAAPATALFFIGGTLVGTSLKGRMKQIGIVSFGKLVIHPILVVLIIQLLPEMDPQLRISAIVLASCPMLTIYPIIASKYGRAEESASTLIVTTFASFLTISIALWFVA
jgi:malonate transporter and related proteins